MGIWEVVSFVASVAFQQIQSSQAKKAQQKALRKREAEEDARKGTSITVDFEVATLKIPYGRNLVGGVKVYYNTLNAFGYVAPIPGFTAFKASEALDVWQPGVKHEYLITQQAICFGGVSAIYEVLVDGIRMAGDYVDAFNNVVLPGTAGSNLIAPYAHGCLSHVHKSGGVADPMAYGNDSSRVNAKFTNACYSTNVYKLDRDDPQYSGAPNNTYILEGMLIPRIDYPSDVVISPGSYAYSNNPARVLLDYLTNKEYGKGLPAEKIDIPSFYYAQQTCDMIVKDDVGKYGYLWTAKGGTRTLRLYECNLALDSIAPLRDNIEAVLDTMENATLIWTGGKYKLRLPYALVHNATTLYKKDDVVQYGFDLYRSLMDNNSSPVTSSNWLNCVDFNVTDDDLVRKDDTTITWPSSQTKLNYYTVRFLNESIDFKEDVVSWPKKDSNAYAVYISEDSQESLEGEEFASGITTYYHALARAESIVRKSRNRIIYSFTLNANFLEVENGDTIKLVSNVLRIPGELLVVTEVDISVEDRTVNVKAEKFDAYDFAWNVSDSEPSPQRKLYSNKIEQVSELSYTVDTTTLNIGTLFWNAPDDIRVASYDVYYRALSVTEYQFLGNTREKQIKIPDLQLSVFDVAVVSRSYFNTTANISAAPFLSITKSYEGNISELTLDLSKDLMLFTSNGFTDPKQAKFRLILTYSLGVITTDWSDKSYIEVPYVGIGLISVVVESMDKYDTVSSVLKYFSFNLSVPKPPLDFKASNGVISWRSPETSSSHYPARTYRVLSHSGYNINHNSAAIIFDLIDTNTIQLPLIYGENTLFVKALDAFGNISSEAALIVVETGDKLIGNILWSIEEAPAFSGVKVNCSVSAGNLVADSIDSLYLEDSGEFYLADDVSFYEASLYNEMRYTTALFSVPTIITGSYMFVELDYTGDGALIEYYEYSSGSFYGADGDDFFGKTTFYLSSEASDGPFRYTTPILAKSVEYLFTISIAGGQTQGNINSFKVAIDVEDIVETVSDLTVNITATSIPISKPFNFIQAVTATLQAGASGAVSVEIDKTNNLAPTIKAYDNTHTAVAAATVDLIIKGY